MAISFSRISISLILLVYRVLSIANASQNLALSWSNSISCSGSKLVTVALFQQESESRTAYNTPKTRYLHPVSLRSWSMAIQAVCDARERERLTARVAADAYNSRDSPRSNATWASFHTAVPLARPSAITQCNSQMSERRPKRKDLVNDQPQSQNDLPPKATVRSRTSTLRAFSRSRELWCCLYWSGPATAFQS